MQEYHSSTQQEMLSNRLPVVIVGLILISAILLFRLMTFQWLSWLSPEVARDFELSRDSNYARYQRFAAARGVIYDRDGQPLASNTFQYGIGVSPNLIADPQGSATQLASVLGQSELELYTILLESDEWVLLARPVSAEIGLQVDRLEIFGVTVDSIPRRLYSQGTLAAHLLGFVAGDGEETRGYNGIEGYYHDQLAGRTRNEEVSTIPFDVPRDRREGDRGSDLVLTIDRDIQFLAESQLLQAISDSGSVRGTIIIMDPRNGDILAMANYPSFDPNAYFNVEDDTLFRNAAVSEVYEPGSVMKVLTVAGALEQGTIVPQWTYNDQGFLDIGGIRIENWDRRAHGVTDVAQVLVQSLNVGVATISSQMGAENFYNMMVAFGIGRPTQVDLQGEESGILKVPGDSNWSESDLGTNSFGQGVSVTPLQMATAVSAIANGGLMMQPRVVYQVIDGADVMTAQPSALGRPISAETARIVTEMMVAVVNDGVPAASLPGYTIAGKTGTAEIASPLGYENNASIVTFIGFLPADDPQVVVLIKLDRPTGYWGSQVAAPVFHDLAERLVNLMEIPTDDVRHALAEQGGSVGGR